MSLSRREMLCAALALPVLKIAGVDFLKQEHPGTIEITSGFHQDMVAGVTPGMTARDLDSREEPWFVPKLRELRESMEINGIDLRKTKNYVRLGTEDFEALQHYLRGHLIFYVVCERFDIERNAYPLRIWCQGWKVQEDKRIPRGSFLFVYPESFEQTDEDVEAGVERLIRENGWSPIAEIHA